MSDAWNAAAGGPGQDPGMFARLMQYINGGAPAAAMAATNQAPNPLNHPTPVPAALQGGGVSTAGLGTPTDSGLPPGVSTMSPNTQNGLPTTLGGGSFGQGGPPPQPMPYAGGQGPVGPAGRAGGHSLLTPPVPNSAVGWGTPQTGGGVNWASDPRLPDFNKLPRPAGPGGRSTRSRQAGGENPRFRNRLCSIGDQVALDHRHGAKPGRRRRRASPRRRRPADGHARFVATF